MVIDERALFDAWMSLWEDLINFEVVPVVTSEEVSTVVGEVQRAYPGVLVCHQQISAHALVRFPSLARLQFEQAASEHPPIRGV